MRVELDQNYLNNIIEIFKAAAAKHCIIYEDSYEIITKTKIHKFLSKPNIQNGCNMKKNNLS